MCVCACVRACVCLYVSNIGSNVQSAALVEEHRQTICFHVALACSCRQAGQKCLLGMLNIYCKRYATDAKAFIMHEKLKLNPTCTKAVKIGVLPKK